MRTYDQLLVGSSPGMLLEAILAARSGLEVALVDACDTPGGAWVGARLPGLGLVECAPHFFQSHVDLGFLREEFGIELVQTPKAVWIVKLGSMRLRLGDRLSKILVQLVGVAKLIGGRRRERSFSRIADDRLDQLSGAFHELAFLLFRYREARSYFSGGCISAINVLAAEARNCGVRFFHDRINCIAQQNGAVVEARLQSGATLSTQQLLLTRRSTIKSIFVAGRSETMQRISVTRNQVHLRLRITAEIPNYLARSAGLSFFAVANLSMIGSANLPPGECLLAVTLADMSRRLPEDHFDANGLLSELKDAGLVPLSSELISSHFSSYIDDRMTDADYARIRSAFPEQVGLIGDIDLSRWMESLSKRWIPAPQKGYGHVR